MKERLAWITIITIHLIFMKKRLKTFSKEKQSRFRFAKNFKFIEGDELPKNQN